MRLEYGRHFIFIDMFYKTKEYARIHQYILKHKKGSVCEICGATDKKLDNALIRGKEYEKKIDNFLKLCRMCHYHYDFPNGRKHTQETKDKMAILSSQRIKIIGVSQKFINAQKGKIRTEIHKQKISESISGDKHHSKKLNKEQVFEIISSKEKPTALARKFNVTYRTIYNIQKRKNWKIID